jgi:site-specific recombinase XerD
MFLASISDKSKSYRITTYSALKRFSSYLAASTINTLDPMQYVKRPKKTKADESIESIEKRNKGFLDVDEISQLKDNIVELPGRMRNTLVDRDTAIVTVFLSTGMRCSALCKLDLSNINANDHTLIVKDKGGKIKVHYLSNKAWEALEKWLNKREAPEDQPALFISSKGGRLTYSGVKKMIDKYTQNIKGKHITPHKLRATYATQLYNETKDIYFVQKCMDHFSPDTTQLYIRGNNDNSKKAAEIMNNLL